MYPVTVISTELVKFAQHLQWYGIVTYKSLYNNYRTLENMVVTEIDADSFIQTFSSALENKNIIKNLKPVNFEFCSEITGTLSSMPDSF